MNTDFSKLTQPRLLIEARLELQLGDLFLTTNFADLGPCIFTAPNGKRKLLVDSAQCVANLLEATICDPLTGKLLPQLDGLPYIRVMNKDKTELTNSVLEVHRVNSEYIATSKTANDELFLKVFRAKIGHQKNLPIAWQKFHEALFAYDPNSLLHGCFLEEIDGRLRVPRIVSGFIEASDIEPVPSGGVKNNRVEPRLKGGKGNVPYPRTYFTAREIVAYFNVDLAQARGLGLKPSGAELLQVLALLKIRRLLDNPIRRRSECDLVMTGDIKMRPNGFTLPTATALLDDCTALIATCKKAGMFIDPAATEVVWSKVRKPIVIEFPAGTATPEIPDEAGGAVEWKKTKDNQPVKLQIEGVYGMEPDELANALFASNDVAKAQLLRELRMIRVEIIDEDLKPKIPAALKKEKLVVFSPPNKSSVGELAISPDLPMSPDELAENLFPDDEAAQQAVRDAFDARP